MLLMSSEQKLPESQPAEPNNTLKGKQVTVRATLSLCFGAKSTLKTPSVYPTNINKAQREGRPCYYLSRLGEGAWPNLTLVPDKTWQKTRNRR